MYFYEGYHLWGMHMLWWIIWAVVLIWIFATPWSIPGERNKTDSPLDILQKRYAGGSISKEEYEAKKVVLIKDRKL